MRFLLLSIISISALLGSFPLETNGESLRGVSQNTNSNNDLATDLFTNDHRELMPTHDMFGSLSCNSSIDPCEGWSDQAYDPSAGTVVIPCGKCITMDLSDGYLSLPHGLNIEGKLVFPDGYQITIETPFIVVQGELEMTSTRQTSGEEDIKIIMTALPEGDVSFTPHAEHSTGPKNVGTRPIAVAGGVLNIHGLADGCPSWVKLKNVNPSPPSMDLNDIPSYIAPPSDGYLCSDTIIETDFEGNQGISWPNGWYRNYGGVHSYETENPATPGSTYALYGGRTSNWNGPQTNFDPACIVPGVTYFIYAKARLSRADGGLSNCHQTGNNCLKIISYMNDSDRGKKWNNRGNGGRHNDGEWFDFVATTVFDDKTADTETAIDRRLYWEGPEAGVDIALDDVR